MCLTIHFSVLLEIVFLNSLRRHFRFENPISAVFSHSAGKVYFSRESSIPTGSDVFMCSSLHEMKCLELEAEFSRTTSLPVEKSRES